MRLRQVFSFFLLLPALSFVAGCAANFTPQTLPDDPLVVQGQPLHGQMYGGQQPVIGSHLYLFAASTLGYGAASISLIKACNTACNATYPSQMDSSGNFYIVTGAGGIYLLVQAQYACTPGQQVYMYSVGGNPGIGNNTAAGEMAILGTCTSGGALSLVGNNYIYENEVSTVAAAYAFAGFAIDPTHVGSNPSSLALTGIQNAFNNSANLFNITFSSTAGALAVTPAGDGTVPQAELNTLANVLSACINGNPTFTSCTTLLGDAKSGGTSGTTPTDTAAVAINIAHNPGANVSAIWGIAPTTGAPFGSPILAAAPNDWTVAINFSDSLNSINAPSGVAIDASGNAWVANNGSACVTKLSPLGSILSGTSGFTNESFVSPFGIAVDLNGNAWVADQGDVIEEVGTNGTILSGTLGFATTDPDNVATPTGIAIDPHGNAWVAQLSNIAFELSGTTGAEISAPNGFPAGSTQIDLDAVAIDAAGNAYFANNKASFGTVAKMSNSGTLASGSAGFGAAAKGSKSNSIALGKSSTVWVTDLGSNGVTEMTTTGTSPTLFATIGGLSAPNAVAIDGAGDVWVSNNNGTLSELSSAGAALSPALGYSHGTILLENPIAIAVDGSGDVWLANSGNNEVTEFIGLGTPVVTPIVASLVAPYSVPASLP